MVNIWPPVECDDEEERLTTPFSKTFVIPASHTFYSECPATYFAWSKMRRFAELQKIFVYYCGVKCKLTVIRDGENSIEIESKFEGIVDDENKNGLYGKRISGSSEFQLQKWLDLPITRQFHYAPINPVHGLKRTLRVNGIELVPGLRTISVDIENSDIEFLTFGATELGKLTKARYEFEDPDDECKIEFGFGGLADESYPRVDKSYSRAAQYIGGFTNTCHASYLRFLNWPETPEDGPDFVTPVRPSFPNISNAEHKLLIEYDLATTGVSVRLSPPRNRNPGGFQKKFVEKPNASIPDFIEQGYEYAEVCGSGGIYVNYW